jgi:ribosome maturation factor RimP
VSAALDDADLLGDASYTLEVSSPGVSRPLTQPRHWRRSAGRLVRVLGRDGEQVTGRVLAADDDGADLDVEGRCRRVSYSQVAKATVQVEFRALDDDSPR